MMAPESPSDPPGPNLEEAIRRQASHESYFLTLTFTLLGLAVQSAEFGAAFAPKVLELAGWAMLFVSGLAGLRRSRYVPLVYRIHNAVDHNRSIAESVQLARARGDKAVLERSTGRTIPIEAAVVETTASVAGMKALLKPEEDKLALLAKTQRLGFAAGVGSVLIARALGAFLVP